jgi:hypothetical protein
MIVLGDVDNDGDIDALISHYKIPNRLWLNDGNGFFTKSDREFGDGGGHFTSLGAVFGSKRVFCIGSKDIDGDGDIDIIFGQHEGTGGNAIYSNE